MTDVSGSLASYLSKVQDEQSSHSRPSADTDSKKQSWPGFLDSSAASRHMILNGSHRTASESSTARTVLVLPDYVFVNEVEDSMSGATELWKSALDPAVGRSGAQIPSTNVKSWPIPYDAVIMMCMFYQT